MSPEYAFLNMAIALADLSKDPSTKVGCILVSPDNKALSTGYNGFPSGLSESDQMWADKVSKGLICKGTAVLHAEENALLNARQSVQGWAAYVTHHPCVRCMGMLGHAGIRQVNYAFPIKPEYKPELAWTLAQQMGITVRCLTPQKSLYFSTTPLVLTVDPKITLESTRMATVSASGANIAPLKLRPELGVEDWYGQRQYEMG